MLRFIGLVTLIWFMFWSGMAQFLLVTIAKFLLLIAALA